MKAQPPERPNEPGKRPKGAPAGPVKPKRTKERGPLGFGSVMRDVGKGSGKGRGAARPDGERGALVDGSFRHGVTQPPQVPGAPAGMRPDGSVDAGVLASSKMGKVETSAELDVQHVRGPEDAVEALAAEDRSATAQLQRGEAGIPTRLGRLTPNAVLGVVVDEATKLAIEEASKELHVELEPEDLGPLIVTLKRDKGRLTVHFRARQADAARVLDAGIDLLEARLRQSETGIIETSVEHDASLGLGGR